MFANMLSWLSTLAWVAACGFLIAWGIASSKGKTRKRSFFLVASLALIFVGIVSTVLGAGLVFIQPQERGVVISAVEADGYRKDILQPGLRWVIPYAENVGIYSISKSTYTMSIAHLEGDLQGDDSIAARTSDGQEVYIDASIIFALDPAEVLDVHIIWQDRYLNGLIRPIVRGIIRDAVSHYKVNEVYSTQREQLKMQIEDELTRSMENNGLILHDFTIHEVLDATEYSTLKSSMLNEEPIVEGLFPEERINFIEGVRRVLQTLACLALPVTFLAEGISRASRKRMIHEPGVSLVEHTTQASDGEKAGETEALTASSPEENYLLGKSLLGVGERSKAIEAFTAVYRTSKDPILKKEALNQLELLDAVKKL